ncbi:nucleoside triphosphate pyrophosphohydrolase [Fodinisporobacter ferrooxydans]|uniref:Nucleoside triphosphate pyrophosphohydrolase n=1 Tax=Fodinisporobacter ferrooxydans TaxID=2901836 RepID=A0ABY4CMZ8_9BACL|nr:nucleoside triphosphate pyrophosphohydrolase [Alicyclobacillaceae bacterium MYW30-H2]
MKIIQVVGLGPGSIDTIPVGSLEILRQASHIILRTERHPIVEQLRKQGIRFSTCDDLYDSKPTFSEVYQSIVDRLFFQVEQFHQIVYAVPGHPGIAETTVKRLKEQAKQRNICIEIGPGKSFLDDLLEKVGVDPADGLLLLDGTDLQAHMLDPGIATLIMQVYNRDVASDVKLTLMEQYPDEYQVVMAHSVGINDKEQFVKCPLYEIDRLADIDHLTTLFVPATTDASIINRQFSTLIDIVRQLRSPEGCPWDRKQTHQTLRKYMLEEAYEVADAIDRDVPADLCEELGDVLLQVALHSQIGTEEGTFTIHDTIASINEKMIRRHPHVFSDMHVQSAVQVIQNWEQIKQQEKAEKGQVADSSFLHSIPSILPAMQMAYQLQKKAAMVGFEWEAIEDVKKKVKEEWAELWEAVERNDETSIQHEFGDLLFAAINLARYLKLDPESALASTNQKFRNRFSYIEKQLANAGIKLGESSLEKMDKLWNEAKKFEQTE